MAISIPERINLYEQLLAAAKQLLQYCRNADWEQEEVQKQIAGLIEQRQMLIDRIQAMGQEPLSPAESKLAEEIMALDEQSAKIITDYKEQFVRKLKQVRQGMRTTKAYNPEAVQTEGYFIDRRE